MLEFMAYDLKGPSRHKELRDGIFNLCEDNLNVRFAPWFLDTAKSPQAVRDFLTKRIAGRLLVLNLGKRTIGAQFNLNPNTVAWLERHHISFDEQQKRKERVLAIAYTLYLADSRDYRQLQSEILRRFPDSCKPVNALWFVSTEQTPKEACEALNPLLPNFEQDQLLVVEMPTLEGAKLNIDLEDTDWFTSHGISLN